MNLSAVTYFTAEQPFINSFATAEQWITHAGANWDSQEEKYVNLDHDGWPISLKSVNEPTPQQYDSLGVVILLGMPDTPNGNYPGGRYVVLYDGQGTLSYGFDAVLVSRSPGRDVINVNPSKNGIDLRIVATDPHHNGKYLRNIRVMAAGNEAAAKAGQIFNPAFVKLLENFRAIRFMDWFRTNDSSLASWGDRPLASNAFFGTARGVPIEVAIQLANAVSADAWVNVPVRADDDYIARMAALIHGALGSSQKVYVELSNEVWNSSFQQFKYAVDQGRALWPARAPGKDGYEYNRQWFGMRTAQMCDIWKAVWRADPRVICVLGAQAAWSYSATEALKCPYWTQGAPCSSHAISAVAVAPYLGGAVPAAWASLPDGGLANLFQSLKAQNDASIPPGGFLADEARELKQMSADLAPYKLALLAYEGGQTFANGSTDALNNLYMAANRDPRMGQAYAQYFGIWKAAGGQLFMYYNDIGAQSKYGSWGALESSMQTVAPLGSAPPKWQAVQRFVAENPCWWAHCEGPIN